jgi:hypothetical protein
LHNIFTKEKTARGYLLLKLMRSYLELDMYASLTVHTESTIKKGREELLTFEKLLHVHVESNSFIPHETQEISQEYIPLSDKSWSFPKAHTHKHMFDDIQQKGATRNYNTKPNEKCHGSLKNSYKFRTNFKNIAPQVVVLYPIYTISLFYLQILKIDHDDLVAMMIREDLDYLDNLESAENMEDDKALHTITGTNHVSLGSPSSVLSISDVEVQHNMDTAFHNFRKKLSQYFSKFFGKVVKIGANEMVSNDA